MPYTIQGNDTPISIEPILQDGKHYIPLREIIQALGGSVSFDNITKVTQAVIGPWTAVVHPDDKNVAVSGNGQTTPVTLTALPILDNDTLYVPFDFLRDAYGYNRPLS